MDETNRVYLTKDSIRRAFLRQIERKDIGRVKASDVIADARVSKATFYRYYKDVYDLLVDCFSTYLDVQEEVHAVIEQGNLEAQHYQLILMGVRKIREHPALYIKCIKCSYEPFLKDFAERSTTRSKMSVRQLIFERGIDQENCLIDIDSLASLCVTLSTEINMQWVQSGCEKDPEEVAQLTNVCICRFIDSMRMTA